MSFRSDDDLLRVLDKAQAFRDAQASLEPALRTAWMTLAAARMSGRLHRADLDPRFFPDSKSPVVIDAVSPSSGGEVEHRIQDMDGADGKDNASGADGNDGGKCGGGGGGGKGEGKDDGGEGKDDGGEGKETEDVSRGFAALQDRNRSLKVAGDRFRNVLSLVADVANAVCSLQSELRTS